MASKQIKYNSKTFTISYDIVNPQMTNNIVILHGWGSNKEIMKQAFGKHMQDLKHIYIDMPGFGSSNNPSIVLKSGDYANIISLFLNELNVDADIIAGHSFGGKVATLLKPKCLVLLSSSGILVPKPFSVRAKIFISKFFKTIGIGKLTSMFVSPDAKGMSHEMYETFKNVVNEEFEHNFEDFNGKALLFWGKSDTATPLWTAEKIQSIIKGSRLFPLDGDHFFFLKHAHLISTNIENLCTKEEA
jgi:pimeloyl-ACP methyl ester carboxylesterase